MARPNNFFSRILMSIAAKRFNRTEKSVLLALTLLGIFAVHLSAQRWKTEIVRNQIVAVPTIVSSTAGMPASLETPATRVAPPADAPEKTLRLRRDPFLPSANPQRSVTTTAVTKPAMRLTVSGILWDDVTPTAIINSRVVGIGDIIYGKAIVDIEKDRVIVMEDGAIQILYFKK